MQTTQVHLRPNALACRLHRKRKSEDPQSIRKRRTAAELAALELKPLAERTSQEKAAVRAHRWERKQKEQRLAAAASFASLAAAPLMVAFEPSLVEQLHTPDRHISAATPDATPPASDAEVRQPSPNGDADQGVAFEPPLVSDADAAMLDADCASMAVVDVYDDDPEGSCWMDDANGPAPPPAQATTAAAAAAVTEPMRPQTAAATSSMIVAAEPLPAASGPPHGEMPSDSALALAKAGCSALHIAGRDNDDKDMDEDELAVHQDHKAWDWPIHKLKRLTSLILKIKKSQSTPHSKIEYSIEHPTIIKVTYFQNSPEGRKSFSLAKRVR